MSEPVVVPMRGRRYECPACASTLVRRKNKTLPIHASGKRVAPDAGQEPCAGSGRKVWSDHEARSSRAVARTAARESAKAERAALSPDRRAMIAQQEAFALTEPVLRCEIAATRLASFRWAIAGTPVLDLRRGRNRLPRLPGYLPARPPGSSPGAPWDPRGIFTWATDPDGPAGGWGLTISLAKDFTDPGPLRNPPHPATYRAVLIFEPSGNREVPAGRLLTWFPVRYELPYDPRVDSTLVAVVLVPATPAGMTTVLRRWLPGLTDPLTGSRASDTLPLRALASAKSDRERAHRWAERQRVGTQRLAVLRDVLAAGPAAWFDRSTVPGGGEGDNEALARMLRWASWGVASERVAGRVERLWRGTDSMEMVSLFAGPADLDDYTAVAEWYEGLTGRAEYLHEVDWQLTALRHEGCPVGEAGDWVADRDCIS